MTYQTLQILINGFHKVLVIAFWAVFIFCRFRHDQNLRYKNQTTSPSKCTLIWPLIQIVHATNHIWSPDRWIHENLLLSRNRCNVLLLTNMRTQNTFSVGKSACFYLSVPGVKFAHTWAEQNIICFNFFGKSEHSSVRRQLTKEDISVYAFIDRSMWTKKGFPNASH